MCGCSCGGGGRAAAASEAASKLAKAAERDRERARASARHRVCLFVRPQDFPQTAQGQAAAPYEQGAGSSNYEAMGCT